MLYKHHHLHQSVTVGLPGLHVQGKQGCESLQQGRHRRGSPCPVLLHPVEVTDEELEASDTVLNKVAISSPDYLQSHIKTSHGLRGMQRVDSLEALS